MIFYNYVALLEGGNYYIGRTEKPDPTFGGKKVVSQWTKLHSIIEVNFVDIQDNDLEISDRTVLTLCYMKRYGIEKVRGGGYSEVELPESKIREIKRYLSKFDQDDSYENIKAIVKKIMKIKTKIYKFSKENGLEYFDLLNKFDQFENNEDFNNTDNVGTLTRSKKRKLFGEIQFKDHERLLQESKNGRRI